MDFDAHYRKFKHIADILDPQSVVDGQLTYSLALEALDGASRLINTNEALEFIDKCLFKMLTMILRASPNTDQNSPGRDRNVISSLLNVILQILMDMPTEHLLSKHFDTLALLFDGDQTYYLGTKSAWGTYINPHARGQLHERTNLLNKFVLSQGFIKLATYSKENIGETDEEHCLLWKCGKKAVPLHGLLLALRNVVQEVDMKEIFLIEVIRGLQTLTEEQLKGPIVFEMMPMIIDSMKRICAYEVDISTPQFRLQQLFTPYWQSFVAKCLATETLPVRLLGWDQMTALINEAHLSKPRAAEYIVTNAGVDMVNGVYKFQKYQYKDNDQSVVYSKDPTSSDEVLLTLSRCKMRNGTKRWFISHADINSPGTDKDIDYYNRIHDEDKTGIDLERTGPPLNKWLVAENKFARGKAPPPILEPRGFIMNEGMTEDSFLYAKLKKYILEAKLMEQVFGLNMHREVVNRSRKMLFFLAENDSVDLDQMNLVWKSAMGADIDTAEEILTTLVQLLEKLPKSLFVDIIDMVSSNITALGKEKWSEATNNKLSKIMLFIENFDVINVKAFNEKEPNKILELAWKLYESPHFDVIKSNDNITLLLQTCFNTEKNESAAIAVKVKESTETLSAFVGKKKVDESLASRVVKRIKFLFELRGTVDNVELALELQNSNTGGCLISEVERFKKCNLSKSAVGSSSYIQEVKNRLHLLRMFYGIHISVNIPREVITRLWSLLSKDSDDLEVFFWFLNAGGSYNAVSGQPIYDEGDANFAFKEYVCSSGLDWSRCGFSAFQCLRNFVRTRGGGVDAADNTENLDLIFDTLWRASLNLPSEKNEKEARNACQLLLDAYEEAAAHDAQKYDGAMLKIALDKLREVHDECKDSSAGGVGYISPLKQTQVSRVIDLMSNAIIRNKSISLPSHGVRGLMGRIEISVTHRRANSYVSHGSGTGNESIHVDRTTVRTIKNMSIHPLHTLKSLLERVSALARFPENGRIQVEIHNRMYKTDRYHEHLESLGVVDGTEVQVMCIAPYQSHHHSTYSNMNNSNNNTVEFEEEEDNYLTHIGQVISSDEEKFACLMGLLDDIQDDKLVKKLWKLMQLIPTQEHIENRVNMVDKIDWDNASPAMTAYLLQIIDHLLTPATELSDDESESRSEEYLKSLLNAGGLSHVLHIMCGNYGGNASSHIASPEVKKVSISVALHILQIVIRADDKANARLVNDSTDSTRDNSPLPEDIVNPVTNNAPPLALDGFFEELLTNSQALVMELLDTASYAAVTREIHIVETSLTTINYLLTRSNDVVQQITSTDKARSLLVNSLMSDSAKVRKLSGRFAVELGRESTTAFNWLIEEVADIDGESVYYEEMFEAVENILTDFILKPEDIANQVNKLATFLVDRLEEYPAKARSNELYAISGKERYVLLGYLKLLSVVLQVSTEPLKDTKLNIQGRLLGIFSKEYLFTTPSKDPGAATVDSKSGSNSASMTAPICDSHTSRLAVFSLLNKMVEHDSSCLPGILDDIEKLSSTTLEKNKQTWMVQLSQEVKPKFIPFSGMKNQGCTCYMNSTLQLLYMCKPFRDFILNLDLREVDRSSLWHRQKEELIGSRLAFDYNGKDKAHCLVTGYDPEEDKHLCQFEVPSDKPTKAPAPISLRKRIENHSVHLAAPIVAEDAVDKDEKPLTEHEVKAIRIVEQLQRLFCFLKYSQTRYFDPILFVEACKTMNMEYPVYQQNDVAEFFDKLFDSIESVSQGHAEGRPYRTDMWKNLKGTLLNGEYLYEKIPMECDHEQEPRRDLFVRIELQVRNKDDIHEALADVFQSELMDGGNKILCEECGVNRATLRRCTMGSLPNALVLHLKRFDLDYETFETVKLNNRLEFPLKLNALKYSKEGVEKADRDAKKNDERESVGGEDRGSLPPSPVRSANSSPRRERSNTNTSQSADGVAEALGGLSVNEDGSVPPSLSRQESNEEPELDEADFEYELEGVLVHAGIAQGGHYYSFARDPDNIEKWYKFDDDYISEWHYSPETIAHECFGGTYEGLHGEKDRTANGLVLFYSKIRPNGPPTAKGEDGSQLLSRATAGTSALPPFPDVDGAESTPSRVMPPAPPTASEQQLVVEQKLNAEGRRLDRTGKYVMINGIEAFEKEVFDSNYEHMIAQYMLDCDLHDFVKSLLNIHVKKAVLAVAEIAEVTSPSRIRGPRSDGGDDNGAASTSDSAVEIEANAASAKSTFAFAIKFFLDVVLHCRDRVKVSEWVNSIQNVFDTFPYTVVTFLHMVLFNGNSYLLDYWFICDDTRSKTTFITILMKAISCIAPSDPQALVTLLGAPKDDLKDQCVQGYTAVLADAENDNNANLSYDLKRFTCAYLVKQIQEQLYHCSLSPLLSKSYEFFHMIKEMALIDSMRPLMIGLEYLSDLTFFVLRDMAPSDVKRRFPYPKEIQKIIEENDAQQIATNKNMLAQCYGRFMHSEHLFAIVTEAVAAIVGAPQPHKVSLLQDREDIYQYDFTNEAKEALTQVFEENCRGNTMSEMELRIYLEKVYGTEAKQASIQVVSLLFDRLSSETNSAVVKPKAFLGYLADQAVLDEKFVWRHLQVGGYRNDLTRTLSNGYQPTNGFDEFVLPTQKLVASLPLPQNCLIGLIKPEYYHTGMMSGGDKASTLATLNQVCSHNLEASVEIIEKCLGFIRGFVLKGQESINVFFIEVFQLMCCCQDELGVERMKVIFYAMDLGLVDMIEKDKSGMFPNPNMHMNNKMSITQVYFNFLRDLASMDSLAAVVTTMAETDERLRDLLTQAQSPDTSFGLDETSFTDYYVEVSGAGNAEANGIYNNNGLLNECAWFRREGIWQGESIYFHVFMCPSNKVKTWWLSAAPLNRKPGDDKYDIDFCNAACQSQVECNSPLPGDTLYWEAYNGNHILSPVPTILLKNHYQAVSTVIDQENPDVSDVYGDFNDLNENEWNGEPFDDQYYANTGRSNSPTGSSLENDNMSTEGIGDLDGDDE